MWIIIGKVSTKNKPYYKELRATAAYTVQARESTI